MLLGMLGYKKNSQEFGMIERGYVFVTVFDLYLEL